MEKKAEINFAGRGTLAPFATLLRDHLNHQGYGQARFSVITGIERSSITKILGGDVLPVLSDLKKIIDVLHLNAEEEFELMAAYYLSSSSVSAEIQVERQAIQEDLRGKVADLELKLQAAVTELEQVTSQQPTPLDPAIAATLNQLVQDVTNLKGTTEDLQKVDDKYFADVVLPTRDEMQVRLVPVEVVDRLSEYMQDESAQLGWATLFLGTLLGILTNLVTGGEMGNETWVVIIVLAVAWLVFAARAREAGQRARRMKNKQLKHSVEDEDGWMQRWVRERFGKKGKKALPPGE